MFLITILGGMQALDSFNRNNFEMLTRLNRLSGSRYPEASSRRYSGNLSDYRSRSTRPLVDYHFPDPLFGSSINSVNATPSEFEREKLSAEGYRERSPSIASSTGPDYSSVHSDVGREKLTPGGYQRAHAQSIGALPEFSHNPLAQSQSDIKAYHQSLAEFGYYGNEKDPFDDEMPMHQSMPDLSHSLHGAFDKKKTIRDAEPIPLHHIRIPDRASLKNTGDDAAVKKTPRSQSIDELQISLSQAARYNTGQISKDLMDCLDKMTYHSIADDNPFEPIPLAPQQEKAHALKKAPGQSEATSDPARSDPYSSNAMIDESERDEFAEE
jgi:hypothetical protein